MRRVAAASRLLAAVLLSSLVVSTRPGAAPAAPAAVAAAAPGLEAKVDRRLRAVAPSLIALRRDLHRHPEVSGQEERTAGVIAARLRKLGLEVRTGVGGHGVVATLRGGRPGPRVAVRADMDAVPSDEPDPVPFASTIPGRRHICGHDVHVAVAVGVAEGLAAVRRTLSGTVVFLFQPAEERATGARAMLADGALAGGKPRAIFAVHTAPLEVGTIGSRPGVMLAGRDGFTIVLEGQGDGLARAARAMEEAAGALDTIDRRAAMFTPQAGPFRLGQGLTSTAEAGGGRWTIEGRIAVSNDSLRDDAEQRLKAAVAGLGAEGVRGRLDYRRREIAGVDNDPALEQRARVVLRSLLGADRFVPVTRVVPAFSEDFGSFQSEVPGVMFWLGVANAAKGIGGMPHSPAYVADEDAILVGARAMSAVVLDALAGGS